MWINRDLSLRWAAKGFQPVRVLVGPRQSGKSSFLEHESDEKRQTLNFDDFTVREFARRDPHTFLNQYSNELILDECQYVPELFPEIKSRVDKEKRRHHENKTVGNISYWLTGSNRILLDQKVSESLTGRASYFKFHTLSVAELAAKFGELPLSILLAKGGWPELHTDSGINPIPFLNDHLQTTLEKELVQTTGIEKVQEFLKVLRLAAGRVGQLFIASEIGKDAGVKSETVSDWLSFVERMMYLIRVPAYSNSLITRLIKAPKLYFSDVSLAVRLQGWTAMEPLLVSPNVGFLFENLIAENLIKHKDYFQTNWELFHWRTKEGEEIDFILSTSGRVLAIECKLSASEASKYVPPPSFQKLKETECVVVSPSGGPSGKHAKHLSIYQLGEYLRNVN